MKGYFAAALLTAGGVVWMGDVAGAAIFGRRSQPTPSGAAVGSMTAVPTRSSTPIAAAAPGASVDKTLTLPAMVVAPSPVVVAPAHLQPRKKIAAADPKLMTSAPTPTATTVTNEAVTRTSAAVPELPPNVISANVTAAALLTPAPRQVAPALRPSASTALRAALEISQTMPEAVGVDEDGKPLPIEILVVNKGADAVEKVVATQLLGDDTEMVSASPEPVRREQRLTWSLGRLEPGEKRSMVVHVRLRADAKDNAIRSEVAVDVQVRGRGEALVRRPMLRLDVEGPVACDLGAECRFVLKITNTGVEAARNIVLVDVLGDGIHHPFGPRLENEIGELASGESRTIPLKLTANRAGKLAQDVVVLASGLPRVRRKVELHVAPKGLRVEARGPETTPVQRACAYQWVITNQTAEPIRGAKLATTLPAGLAFAHASDSGEHDPALRTVCWTLGDLAPGEQRVVDMVGVAQTQGAQAFHALLAAEGEVRAEASLTTEVKSGEADKSKAAKP